MLRTNLFFQTNIQSLYVGPAKMCLRLFSKIHEYVYKLFHEKLTIHVQN